MGFKVDVPVDEEDKEGKKGKKSADAKKGEQAMKDLTKQIALGNIIASTLSSVTDGLRQLIAPLVRVLSALFVVIFLPLLPLLRKLTEGIGKFVVDVAEAGGGFKGLVEALKKNFDADEFIGLAAVLAGLLIVSFGVGLSLVGWALLFTGAFVLASEDIAQGMVDAFGAFWTVVLTTMVASLGVILLAPFVATGTLIAAVIGGLVLGLAIVAFDPLKKLGTWLWDKITGFLDTELPILGNLGQWLWDAITGVIAPGLKAVAGIGDFVKEHFSTGGESTKKSAGVLVDLATITLPFQNDFVMRPGQGAVPFSSSDTLIGVKDTSKLGGGSVTINVNNPTVRSENDIRKLVDMISKKLQQKGNRRMSSR